jgi:nicotinate-nucleotide adenylyltransferase
MQNKYKRIGISGGTFDPIHNGHLLIAEHARELFKLDIVLFIPSGMPPHKIGLEVSSAEHRMDMVREAVSTNPFFSVSDIETARPGYTYTIDTLETLRAMYEPSVKLYFIVGADVISDLLTWKSPDRVFSLCELVAVFRPGRSREDTFLREVERLRVEHGAVIHTAAAPVLEISSTVIRARVREGMSVKYMVPESVEEYIVRNKLYV